MTTRSPNSFRTKTAAQPRNKRIKTLLVTAAVLFASVLTSCSETDDVKNDFVYVPKLNIKAEQGSGERLMDFVVSGRRFDIDLKTPNVASNEDLSHAFSRLDALCAEHDDLAFYFKDLETRSEFCFGSDKKFYAKNLIYAPYVKSIISQKTDASEAVKISSVRDAGGDSAVSQAVGKKLTLKDLAEYAVKDSDKAAYVNLLKKYGYGEFNRINKALKTDVELSRDDYDPLCTAKDIALEYENLYKYSKKGSHGGWLLELMRSKENDGEYVVGVSDEESYSVHKVVLRTNGKPYIFVIMTSADPKNKQSEILLKRVESEIVSAHDAIFGE